MVGLVDIGPVTREVPMRGQTIAIKGISALGLFDLLDQFPELRKLFSESGKQVNAQQMMQHVPAAVATIIVYVCGYKRASLSAVNNTEKVKAINAEYEAALVAAESLTIGEQTEIVKAAWDLTFPKGLKSFLEALEAVGAIESGWAQDTASPGPSNNASPTVIPQT